MQDAGEGIAYHKQIVAICCHGYGSPKLLVPALDSIEPVVGFINIPSLNNVVLVAGGGVESASGWMESQRATGVLGNLLDTIKNFSALGIVFVTAEGMI